MRLAGPGAVWSLALDSNNPLETEMRINFYLWILLTATLILGGRELRSLHAAQARQVKTSADFEHVHALALGTSGETLFLGAHTGLFKSEDAGRSWKKGALQAKHSHLDIMAVTPDPKDPKTIYVATHEAGVFKSTDGGKTWKEVDNGLGGVDVHGLAIDPNVPAKLHAAVREKGDGIYRTTDGGARWIRVDDGPGGEVKVLASVNIPTGMGGIFLYAGTAEGLQRSPDCFLGWTKVGGLPTNRTVNGFALDPENPKVMYVAMRDGLFKSTDAGETWKPIGTGLKNLAAVTVNPKKPSEIYAATAQGIIFKSTDGGTKWQRQ